ncbi:MAG: DUF2721 domain-containing protein [Verrucomicrobiae bacterium]|nr:DUF2721 domain-containing protein [Verrucomicrobiae bacterium]
MKLDISTPALFFPTVSLLLLAYTNRFLALAAVIRQLHSQYQSAPDKIYLKQIASLRTRIRLVRNMQFWGVLSLLLCTLCTFLIFIQCDVAAVWLFVSSMVSMIASLLFSLWEIRLSVVAIDLHLSDIENDSRRRVEKGGPAP